VADNVLRRLGGPVSHFLLLVFLEVMEQPVGISQRSDGGGAESRRFHWSLSALLLYSRSRCKLSWYCTEKPRRKARAASKELARPAFMASATAAPCACAAPKSTVSDTISRERTPPTVLSVTAVRTNVIIRPCKPHSRTKSSNSCRYRSALSPRVAALKTVSMRCQRVDPMVTENKRE